MNPDQSFVSSCVISLGPKNRAKKTQGSPAPSAVTIAEPPKSGPNLETQNGRKKLDNQQVQVVGNEKVDCSWQNLALNKVERDLQEKFQGGSLAQHGVSSYQENYAKMYENVRHQQFQEESSSFETSSSHCEVSESCVQETTKIMQQTSLEYHEEQSISQSLQMEGSTKYNGTHGGAMLLSKDANQVACFDDMKVYEAASATSLQREEFCEFSEVATASTSRDKQRHNGAILMNKNENQVACFDDMEVYKAASASNLQREEFCEFSEIATASTSIDKQRHNGMMLLSKDDGVKVYEAASATSLRQKEVCEFSEVASPSTPGDGRGHNCMMLLSNDANQVACFSDKEVYDAVSMTSFQREQFREFSDAASTSKESGRHGGTMLPNKDAKQVAHFDGMQVYEAESTNSVRQEQFSKFSEVASTSAIAQNYSVNGMHEEGVFADHAQYSSQFVQGDCHAIASRNNQLDTGPSRQMTQQQKQFSATKNSEFTEFRSDDGQAAESHAAVLLHSKGHLPSVDRNASSIAMQSERFRNQSHSESVASKNVHESKIINLHPRAVEDNYTQKSPPIKPEDHFASIEFIYPARDGDFIESEQEPDPSPGISIRKGNVKLKSKAFESNKSFTAESANCAELSSHLSGIVQDSVTALQFQSHEERHESQVVGDDALDVDGHVRVKQTLFETLPVEALYEHGQTHSSQIVTRGRRKSNLDQVLNEFNTKALGDINDNEKSCPEKDIVDFDVNGAVTSFKTLQGSKVAVNKDDLHESQRVDYDIPIDNNLVKENSERFLQEDFCYKSEYQSSQNLTEEEKVAASGLFTSMKGEFESKPLDFIGLDARPDMHPSQLIEDEHMRKATEHEEFILCEPHSSQQINYHERLLSGLTQVKEKRRQYYDHCNSPVRCMSRELIENSEILNSTDLSGMVKQTAAVYLEDGRMEEHGHQQNQKMFCNEIYVKPLKNKFESQTLSQLGKSDELHPSQRVDTPDGLSEEALLRAASPENLSIHMSQVINPSEYAVIKTGIGEKRKAFAVKHASESCPTPPPSELHPSQVVGHDIHLISSSETEESHSRIEKSHLHESQKVNYGVVRPPTRNQDRTQRIDSASTSVPQDSSRPSSSRSRNEVRPRSSMVKSPEADDKDLELLLNYTPVVKQELPSMVTVMVKGVPDELIKSGHPMLTEYVTDTKRGKRISVGSRSSTPKRNTSLSSEAMAVKKNREHSQISKTCKTKHQDFVVNDFVEPLMCSSENRRQSLPSYPDSVSPKSGCDVTDQSLPPPPPQFRNDFNGYESFEDPHPDFITAPHPDFVIGSSVCNPSRRNNIITTSDAELPFLSIEQEHALKERLSKRSNRQMTSSTESMSFLRVRDEDFSRRISAVTVDSYPESDDQWDFVS